MVDKIPILVVPANKSYYLAKRFSSEVMPLMFSGEFSFTQQSYQDTPVFKDLFPFISVVHLPLDLVPRKEEMIIEMMPSFWHGGYGPWVSLFDRLVEKAGYETAQSNATHFSLDLFTAHLWISDLPEYYLGLGLSARLWKYVRRDSLI